MLGKQLSKYVGLSLGAYGVVFLSIYVLTDLFGLNPSASFFITYFFTYIWCFFAQSSIFSVERSRKNAIKFVLHILVFFGFSNVVFNLLLGREVQYLLATGLTILIVFPLRFLSSKYLVFND